MTAPTIVIGGGLAGTTAAVRLADAGREVLLLESRPRLGGMASSFDRDGVGADTGQHVMLRCYTAYRNLLARMGVEHLVPLQPRLDIPVLLPGGRLSHLRRAWHGPAPLHLLPALARYSALTPTQRFTALRAAAALRSIDPLDPASDDAPFGAWLRDHGQDDTTIRRLWGLVTVAALNIDPSLASLALAARVFHTGLLDQVAGGDIGVPEAPLFALHDLAARRLLERLGVQTRTGARVLAIRQQDGQQVVTVRSGADQLAGDVTAPGVVLAVPHQQAARLASLAATPDRDQWAALDAAPIVNVHVHLDRRVMTLPFAAAPESPVQWVFDRTTAAGAAGQYLLTSVSAADEVAALPAKQIQQRQLAALAALLPAVRGARVLDAFVTREPRATFRQQAGTARIRPEAATRLPGLTLAGAWTATGWPDTLEGAVRSGILATDALLHAGARPDRPDRRPCWAEVPVDPAGPAAVDRIAGQHTAPLTEAMS